MPPEAKKAKWEDQVDGETTTLYEIVQKATSAAAAEAEKYVDEKTRKLGSFHKSKDIGTNLEVP
eukprot:jgi/Pico_ML_1/54208/g4615.t2